MAAGNYGANNPNAAPTPAVRRAAVVPPHGGAAPANHPAYHAAKPSPAPSPTTKRTAAPRTTAPASTAPHIRATYYTPKKKSSGGISGGSASVILVLGIVMILITQWKTVVVPAADIIWNKGSTTSISVVDWKIPLGMALLLLVMIFVATINADLAGFMTLIMFAFLAVYLVETNGGGVTSLINWLNPNPPSQTKAGAPAPTG